MLTLAGSVTAAQAHAVGVIKRKKTVVRPGADPAAAMRVRFLAGDPDAFRRRDKRAATAARRTPWLNDWRRRLDEVLGASGTVARGTNPLADVDLHVRVLASLGGETPGARRPSLNWLACRAGRDRAPQGGVKSQIHVVRVASTGEHLLHLAVSCRHGANLRRSRLLLQTDSQGAIQAATGLSLVLRPPRAQKSRQAKRAMPAWPLRPATLRGAFAWLLQTPDNGWLAQVQWLPEARWPTGTWERLPGVRPGGRQMPIRSLRAAIRFGPIGRPSGLLFAGPVAATSTERRAAAARRSGESRLRPLASDGAAEPVQGVGLWEVAGPAPGGALWLQLVAVATRRPPGVDVWTGAGYAGWRWQGGALKRVSVALPRSSGEGLWSCLSLQPRDQIDCRFDAGSMPGAKVFQPRAFKLPPSGGPTPRRKGNGR